MAHRPHDLLFSYDLTGEDWADHDDEPSHLKYWAPSGKRSTVFDYVVERARKHFSLPSDAKIMVLDLGPDHANFRPTQRYMLRRESLNGDMIIELADTDTCTKLVNTWVDEYHAYADHRRDEDFKNYMAGSVR